METQTQPTLLDHWCQLAADVEWLCHVGVGYFFAPWHEPTRREYLAFRDALSHTVTRMYEHGVIRPERAALIRAAVAAHGEAYLSNASVGDMRHRDQVLRRATQAPVALREGVRKSVPAAAWPLPEYIAPPAEPARRVR